MQQNIILNLTEGIINYTYNGGINHVTKLIDDKRLCRSIAVGSPYAGVSTIKIRNPEFQNTIFVVSDSAKKELLEIISKNDTDFWGNKIHHSPITIYTAKDIEFNHVDEVFKNLERQAQLFFEHCRDHKNCDEHFLNQVFHRSQDINFIRLSAEKSTPVLHYSPFRAHYFTLEQELEDRIFIQPFFNGYIKQWIKNRPCDECGRIYFYKSERAQFCSDACRMRKIRRES